MSLSNRRHEGDSAYESFSDLMLGVTVLLIALVAVLAINVSVKSDNAIKNLIYNNRFTGGVERPKVYLSAYRYSYEGVVGEEALRQQILYGNSPLVITMLESPSHARTYTRLDEKGQTVSDTKGASFDGKSAFDLVDLYHLAGGIEAGEFLIGDEKNMLLNVFFGNKNVLLSRVNRELSLDLNLTEAVVSTAWPLFNRENQKVHSFGKYKESNLYVFIESEITPEGQKRIWIGDTYFVIPDKMNSGELDFLVGFSSPNTQIVYLGEYSKGTGETNKRIQYFKSNGFETAASDYLFYHFTAWDSVHERIYQKIPKNRSTEETKEEIRKAVFNAKLSSEALNQKPPSEDILPPLLKHRRAWLEYSKHFSQNDKEVPSWIVQEFLNPLGYNKRIPREEETVSK
jgi:hypothetical protein